MAVENVPLGHGVQAEGSGVPAGWYLPPGHSGPLEFTAPAPQYVPARRQMAHTCNHVRGLRRVGQTWGTHCACKGACVSEAHTHQRSPRRGPSTWRS